MGNGAAAPQVPEPEREPEREESAYAVKALGDPHLEALLALEAEKGVALQFGGLPAVLGLLAGGIRRHFGEHHLAGGLGVVVVDLARPAVVDAVVGSFRVGGKLDVVLAERALYSKGMDRRPKVLATGQPLAGVEPV